MWEYHKGTTTQKGKSTMHIDITSEIPLPNSNIGLASQAWPYVAENLHITDIELKSLLPFQVSSRSHYLTSHLNPGNQNMN